MFKVKIKSKILSILFAIIPAFIVGSLVYGASVYYDLDTSKVIVNEIQRIAKTGQVALEVLGITRLGDGGAANYAEFSQTGDLTFTGTADTITGPGAGGMTMTNAAGALTVSTTGSGALSLTSAGALNLFSGAASTWTLPVATVNALNISSNLMSFDTANSRVGIGTSAPVSALDVRGTIENGLVGWWPMDEGTGSTAVDYSIGGHNGAISASVCPSGYILVPGNPAYGTGDFCVMQYEAKCAAGDEDGSNGCTSPFNAATSRADGSPWASITQTAAITACASAGGHLITNNEWMTIARNAEQIAGNWSSGIIGTGCLYRGNNGTADACGYNGSDPEYGAGRDVKASLALSNGQTIWDIAGNVWEWTNNTISCAGANCTAREMPYDASPASEWVEFTALARYGSLSYSAIRPSNSTWNSTYGMGKIYTDVDAASPSGNIHAFYRGGNWSNGADAGVFALALSFAPSNSVTSIGFRCVR